MKTLLLICDVFLLLAWIHFGKKNGWKIIDIIAVILQAIIVIYSICN